MPRREVHEGDLGRSITLAVGDEVVLVLAENPTTGYRWAAGGIDAAVLAPGASSFRPRGAGLGAGGERCLAFSAVGAGRTHVALRLARAWEGEGSVQRRVSVDVVVAA